MTPDLQIYTLHELVMLKIEEWQLTIGPKFGERLY